MIANDLRLRKRPEIRLYCGAVFGGFHFLVMTKTTTSVEPVVSQTPPVIFLDFEGVLSFPDGTWSVEAMAELNRLCLETGAGVVLTTLDRYGSSVAELRRMLLDNGLDKAVAVLGETRDLGAYRAAEKSGDLQLLCEFERWSKGREIAAWLNEHPGATRFVVIDDQPHICAPYGKRTVVPMGAFSAGDRVRAMRLLLNESLI